MSFLLYTSIILFILICLLLILIILIQKGRGGGLSSAFGGGGGGNTAFGAKTGDVLTWATSVIFGVFLVLAIVLNLLANYRHNQAKIEAGVATPTSVQLDDFQPGAAPGPQAPQDDTGAAPTGTDAPAE